MRDIRYRERERESLHTRARAKEIFSKKPKPCRAAQKATKRLRKRVRASGRGSKNKKDNNKPFVQETLKLERSKNLVGH